ncbi:MAG: hypothetical protein KME40_01610 [Komarekiella atlantica HA4396-MV6]|nr:hypothetical protein [Komarekiella atlantica HA4396-MV6]
MFSRNASKLADTGGCLRHESRAIATKTVLLFYHNRNKDSIIKDCFTPPLTISLPICQINS